MLPYHRRFQLAREAHLIGSGAARGLVRAVTAALGVGPLIWVGAAAGIEDVSGAPDVVRLAGAAAGVAGLSWLLLAMVLSIRVPGLDGAFGGLLSLWRFHHRLGAASFVLVMLHPVLLALAAAADGPRVVLAVLTPSWQAWPVWSGWVALLLMMVYLAPSFAFFGHPRYQRWKTLHRLSAAAVLLAVVHGVALSRALPGAQALWLWGGFGALAGVAFVWRLLLSRWLSRRDYVISHVQPLAEGVVELTLDGPPLAFRPGQFVYLTPLDSALGAGCGEEHPYSIVSAPHEDVVRIGVKDLGDASHALLDVTPGSRALLEGPYGEFLPAAHQEPALWIGGGIGLTPFVSAARSFARSGGPADVHLVYCANDPTRAYYLDELKDIAAREPGFTVQAHYFAEQGPLSLEYLRANVPSYAWRQAYVCGPLPLLDLARRLLRDSGVPRRHITTEEFNLL